MVVKSGPVKPGPKSPATAPKAPPALAVGPLSILPSIARIKVTTHGKIIAVVEEVILPSGGWTGESLSFHVAFGAPGPKAIDAHLVAVGDGALEADDDDSGEVLAVDRVPRRPVTAHPLLGRDTMAGVVVHVRADALSHAFASGHMASLRIRSLIDSTEPDPSQGTSVVVRLGSSRGTPLTLGRIVAMSATPSSPLTRVEARLCGPEADTHLLAVGTTPKLAPSGEPAIAPVLSVRHVTDDVCIRLWQTPGP